MANGEGFGCRILAGMRHSLPGSAGVPLRAVVVALILAGFGLWQAWNCTDGMMMSPMAATTMTATMSHDASTGHLAAPVHAAPHHEAPGMPAGMAGLCITVLASFAAALILMSSPLRLLGLLRRLGALLLRPVDVAAIAPALAQLCVSRT